MNKKIRKNKGFTLVELLVSLIIVTFVTMMIVAGFIGIMANKKSLTAKNAAEDINRLVLDSVTENKENLSLLLFMLKMQTLTTADIGADVYPPVDAYTPLSPIYTARTTPPALSLSQLQAVTKLNVNDQFKFFLYGRDKNNTNTNRGRGVRFELTKVFDQFLNYQDIKDDGTANTSIDFSSQFKRDSSYFNSLTSIAFPDGYATKNFFIADYINTTQRSINIDTSSTTDCVSGNCQTHPHGLVGFNSSATSSSPCVTATNATIDCTTSRFMDVDFSDNLKTNKRNGLFSKLAMDMIKKKYKLLPKDSKIYFYIAASVPAVTNNSDDPEAYIQQFSNIEPLNSYASKSLKLTSIVVFGGKKNIVSDFLNSEDYTKFELSYDFSTHGRDVACIKTPSNLNIPLTCQQCKFTLNLTGMTNTASWSTKPGYIEYLDARNDRGCPRDQYALDSNVVVNISPAPPPRVGASAVPNGNVYDY